MCMLACEWNRGRRGNGREGRKNCAARVGVQRHGNPNPTLKPKPTPNPRPFIRKFCIQIDSYIEDNGLRAAKERAEEASLIGYDLSGLEREMTEAAADELRKAFAELKSCDHDYSVLCPFAWSGLPGESACKAPNAYIGEVLGFRGLGLRVPIARPCREVRQTNELCLQQKGKGRKRKRMPHLLALVRANPKP